MRFISWLFWAVLFVVALLFAITNTAVIDLNFFGNLGWRAPLIVFLLIAFVAGAATGLLAIVPTLFRQRREIARLRKDLKLAARSGGAASLPPLADAPPAVDAGSGAVTRLGG